MFVVDFVEGFAFTLGVIVALVLIAAVLGLGYFAVLFARATLMVWRRRR